MVMPPGAFFMLALVTWFFRSISNKNTKLATAETCSCENDKKD
jgi:hypothetical protein